MTAPTATSASGTTAWATTAVDRPSIALTTTVPSAFSQAGLTQGPRISASLPSSRRRTVALGSRIAASAWLPVDERPERDVGDEDRRRAQAR